MLVCVKCEAEYEEGTLFCLNCGGTLVKRESPSPAEKDLTKSQEPKVDKRLICPNCHILYEKLTTCIRCGASLVTQAALRAGPESPQPEAKKEEPKLTSPTVVKKESPSVPPAGKLPPEAKVEGLKPSLGAEIEKPKPPPTQTRREAPRSVAEEKEDIIYPAEILKKIVHSRAGILFLVFLFLAVSYVLMSLYFGRERISPESPSATKIAESPKRESSPPSNEPSPPIPPSSLPVVHLPQEVQGLHDVLENVRQANLKKNIGLLMSCYSSEYKDLDERRRAALKSWSAYNYLDLEYVLKVESVSPESAKARVEWRIRSIPIKGGRTEEGRSVLHVVFQKEGGTWKIKEVKPIK